MSKLAAIIEHKPDMNRVGLPLSFVFFFFGGGGGLELIDTSFFPPSGVGTLAVEKTL